MHTCPKRAPDNYHFKTWRPLGSPRLRTPSESMRGVKKPRMVSYTHQNCGNATHDGCAIAKVVEP